VGIITIGLLMTIVLALAVADLVHKPAEQSPGDAHSRTATRRRLVRRVALVLIMVTFAAWRVQTALNHVPANHVERVKSGEQVTCDDDGLYFAWRYLEAPTVVPPCP
jgi:hypothetical protein